MCEILNIPLVSIGEALGGRDHTTVIHSREKVSNLVKVNDRVIYEKYGGTEVKIDGVEYLLVQESKIMAVIE